MMEYNQIAKQTIDFQKSAFISGYDAVARAQDQTAEAVEMMLNKTSLPLDRLLNRADIADKVRDFRMPTENSTAAESARQLEQYRQRSDRSDTDRR